MTLCICAHDTLYSVSSDEDMQSLASLMSMKQADIGNLDDFEEENEEDEENRVNQEEKAAKITGDWCRESLKTACGEMFCDCDELLLLTGSGLEALLVNI